MQKESGGRDNNRDKKEVWDTNIKENEQKKETEGPKDPRARSPRTYERGYERGNSIDLSDRDSRSPVRRHDWKKDSERKSSRDSSKDSKKEEKRQ